MTEKKLFNVNVFRGTGDFIQPVTDAEFAQFERDCRAHPGMNVEVVEDERVRVLLVTNLEMSQRWKDYALDVASNWRADQLFIRPTGKGK